MTIKKLVKIFLTTTLVLLMVITGLLAFYVWKAGETQRKLAEAAYQAAEQKRDNNVLDAKLADPQKESQVCTLIYLGSENSKREIASAYICFYDRNEKTLKFISVPGESCFEISNELYKDLAASQANLGQIVRLSQVYRYFKSENGLRAGMLMLNEYLGINIGHYMFIPAGGVDKIFYFNEKGKSVFLSDFQAALINGDSLTVNSIIDKCYKAGYTDMTKGTIEDILAEMEGMNPNSITFASIPGNRKNRGFMIDSKKALGTMFGGGG